MLSRPVKPFLYPNLSLQDTPSVPFKITLLGEGDLDELYPSINKKTIRIGTGSPSNKKINATIEEWELSFLEDDRPAGAFVL